MDFRDDIRKLRAAKDRRKGHFRLETLIPVSKIVTWLTEEDPEPCETEWVYDGCDCIPEDGARSVPYCESHYNPLIRKEI